MKTIEALIKIKKDYDLKISEDTAKKWYREHKDVTNIKQHAWELTDIRALVKYYKILQKQPCRVGKTGVTTRASLITHRKSKYE